jgi:hypothetical protein
MPGIQNRTVHAAVAMVLAAAASPAHGQSTAAGGPTAPSPTSASSRATRATARTLNIVLKGDHELDGGYCAQTSEVRLARSPRGVGRCGAGCTDGRVGRGSGGTSSALLTTSLERAPRP